MPDYTAKHIDEMYATYLGGFKHARAELGVTAFGMQVIDFPSGSTAHPEHDHSESGQEEVYVVLSGSGRIEIEGERVALEPGVIVRVGPQTKRKIVTEDQPMRLLALGGTPGTAYEPDPGTEVGAPDPLARQSG